MIVYFSTGDSFSQIARSFGAPNFISLRSNMILGMTMIVIFPLCCLQKLDALKYTSMLGLTGVLYCALFTVLRCVDGSYRLGGAFFDQIGPSLRPSFNLKETSMVSIF